MDEFMQGLGSQGFRLPESEFKARGGKAAARRGKGGDGAGRGRGEAR